MLWLLTEGRFFADFYDPAHILIPPVAIILRCNRNPSDAKKMVTNIFSESGNCCLAGRGYALQDPVSPTIR